MTLEELEKWVTEIVQLQSRLFQNIETLQNDCARNTVKIDIHAKRLDEIETITAVRASMLENKIEKHLHWSSPCDGRHAHSVSSPVFPKPAPQAGSGEADPATKPGPGECPACGCPLDGVELYHKCSRCEQVDRINQLPITPAQVEEVVRDFRNWWNREGCGDPVVTDHIPEGEIKSYIAHRAGRGKK